MLGSPVERSAIIRRAHPRRSLRVPLLVGLRPVEHPLLVPLELLRLLVPRERLRALEVPPGEMPVELPTAREVLVERLVRVALDHRLVARDLPRLSRSLSAAPLGLLLQVLVHSLVNHVGVGELELGALDGLARVPAVLLLGGLLTSAGRTPTHGDRACRLNTRRGGTNGASFGTAAAKSLGAARTKKHTRDADHGHFRSCCGRGGRGDARVRGNSSEFY